MAKEANSMTKSTVGIGVEKAGLLQKGPHTPVTYPSLRRMKKHSPTCFYFKP